MESQHRRTLGGAKRVSVCAFSCSSAVRGAFRGVGAILDGARDGGELRSISASVRLAARVSRLAEVARLRISALNASIGH